MNTNEQIKILVADDHKLFRAGIIKILSGLDNLAVIGEAGNGEELIKKYFELLPDILLVDISMPVLSGVEAVKKIKETNGTVKALFLSMYDSEEYVYSCLIAGGTGLINKNSMEEELHNAIVKVYKGERYFGKAYPEEKLMELLNRYKSIRQKSNDADISTLTKRELEILELIGEGFTNIEIADKVMLSVRTVETHRAHISQKLGVKSLTELIKTAISFTQNEKTNSF
jgi:two-component system, NarL family, response regulator NreC